MTDRERFEDREHLPPGPARWVEPTDQHLHHRRALAQNRAAGGASSALALAFGCALLGALAVVTGVVWLVAS